MFVYIMVDEMLLGREDSTMTVPKQVETLARYDLLDEVTS